MKTLWVALQDSEGTFLLPEAVEVDSMQHVIVYDSNTSSSQEPGNRLRMIVQFTKQHAIV